MLSVAADLQLECEQVDGDVYWSLEAGRRVRDLIADGELVGIMLEGERIAVVRAIHFLISYSYGEFADGDWCVVIRLEEVLDPDRWRAFPWARRQPGELFWAFNHWDDQLLRDGDYDDISFPEGMTWEEVQAAVDDGQTGAHFS